MTGAASLEQSGEAAVVYLRHPASGRIVVDRGDTRAGLTDYYGSVQEASYDEWLAQHEAQVVEARPVDRLEADFLGSPLTPEQLAATVIRSNTGPAPTPVVTSPVPTEVVQNRRTRR